MLRTMLLSVAVLSIPAVGAAQDLQKPIKTFQIPINRGGGYTQTFSVNVYSQKVADMMEKYLEKKPLQQDIQNYGNGGEWTDYAMMMGEVNSFINIACAFFAGAVLNTGGLSIYIDAMGALCASFVIVTEGEVIGANIWKAWTQIAAGSRANLDHTWFAFLGTCYYCGQ